MVFAGNAETPPRTDAEMAKWLGFVETILDRAVEQRQSVDAIIKEHGPDARIVGDRLETKGQLLRGIKVADIPVAQPTSLSWSSTSRPLMQRTVPPALLVRADRVIE
jgi:hypothetical protein